MGCDWGTWATQSGGHLVSWLLSCIRGTVVGSWKTSPWYRRGEAVGALCVSKAPCSSASGRLCHPNLPPAKREKYQELCGQSSLKAAGPHFREFERRSVHCSTWACVVSTVLFSDWGLLIICFAHEYKSDRSEQCAFRKLPCSFFFFFLSVVKAVTHLPELSCVRAWVSLSLKELFLSDVV